MKKELAITSAFLSPKTGILHTNRLKLRAEAGYLQVHLKSGVLGRASIRLEPDQIDDLINFLQQLKDVSTGP